MMIRELMEDRFYYCGNERLNLNEACLESASHSWVEIQSSECVGCPSWNYSFLHKELVVNTTYPSRITIPPHNDSSVMCNFDYKFSEFGLYELNKDCHVRVIHEGRNIFLPIFWSLGLFLVAKFLWVILMRIYETRACRRMIVSFIMRTDPGGAIISRGGRRNITLSSIDEEFRSRETINALDLETRNRSSRRLKSLDTFRGLAIAIMIFVNYGGGGYWFFNHAKWNGLTLADVVFPWFMWIMGVSLVISIHSQLRNSTPKGILIRRTLFRCISMIFLGLILNSSNGRNNVMFLRIPGVLQRLGISYLINGMFQIIFLKREDSIPSWASYIKEFYVGKAHWIGSLVFLIPHILLTFYLPVPGCPSGYLGPGGLHDGGKFFNCTGGSAGYIDQMVFGDNHMYTRPTSKSIYDSVVPYDPEGLLATFTTGLFTTFLGVHAGLTIILYPGHWLRLRRWIAWSLLLGLASAGLCGISKEDGIIPVNKNLWSLSYVLGTVSLAYLLMAIMYATIDVYKIWKGSPFRYAGMNPIFLYVGHEVLRGYLPFGWNPYTISHAEQLFMNLWGTSMWLLIAYISYKKKFFVTL